MTQLKWTNDRIRLGNLKPWERNPRYSTEDDTSAIVESYELWGQSDVICIDSDNNVLNGHQRLSAWMAKYGPDFEVDVRRADRVFDEAEKQAFTAFMHAKAVGRFDFNEIANWGWDTEEYESFGFTANSAKQWHSDAFALEELLAVEDEVQSLDDLANEYGEPGERDFWPFIRVQVSPGTMEKWDELMDGVTETDDEAEKVEIILSSISR